MVSGKVSRYCLAHAECPVIAVPPPAFAREVGHGPLVWAFWHRTLTPDRAMPLSRMFPGGASRPMITRWISEVPSKMVKLSGVASCEQDSYW
jgi:hypothetical protein